MGDSTANWLSRVILLGVTISVALVQIKASMNPYYGYDEAWHLYLSSVSPLWKALEEMAVDPHPPLYYLMLRPLVSAGPEPFWPRLLSVVPAVLSIPLWYALLRKLNIARGVALTLTAVLASAHGFNELGVTVRAYSLAGFCLLGALWFWCDFVPGTRGKPSRLSLNAFLLLVTAAFWFAYYAVFFSVALIGATLIASLTNQNARGLLEKTWGDCFRWPERLGFVGAHLLGGAWFLAGFGRGGLAAPPHVSPFLLPSDGSIWQFALEGLRGYMAMFTPLAGLGRGALTIGFVALAMILTALIAVEIYKEAIARSALLITIPLALLIIAIAGIAGFYPFGGYLRHQYLLFPFLLLVLAFALDLAYKKLPNNLFRAMACGLVLGIALTSTARARQADPIGEAPPVQTFGNEIEAIFGVKIEPVPVYMTVYPFYVVYADRFGKGIDYRNSYGHDESGWIGVSQLESPVAGLQIRREWDEYAVSMDSGKQIPLFRDRTLFHLPTAPDGSFFERLQELMHERSLRRLRVLRPHGDQPLEKDVTELSALFEAYGFVFQDYQWSESGTTWLVESLRHHEDSASPVTPSD